MNNPFSSVNKEIAGLRRHLAQLVAQSDAAPAHAQRILSATRSLKNALRKRAILYAVALVVAVALGVGAFLMFQRDSNVPASNPDPEYTIRFEGHRIPMDQLRVVDAHPGCNQAHYHAAQGGSVTALDGTVIPDEDRDCGYAPVE